MATRMFFKSDLKPCFQLIRNPIFNRQTEPLIINGALPQLQLSLNPKPQQTQSQSPFHLLNILSMNQNPLTHSANTIGASVGNLRVEKEEVRAESYRCSEEEDDDDDYDSELDVDMIDEDDDFEDGDDFDEDDDDDDDEVKEYKAKRK